MQPTTEILARISRNSLANKDEIFTRLYRYMLRSDLYFLAYKNLYANNGAATKGANDDTADGFSEAKIANIIQRLADETYQPTPVRRTYIKKKNNPKKKRPLGIPTFTDKLVQEVLRMVLEAVYEPVFLPVSHGFRPKRSCHTALKSLKMEFNGMRWFVEGDIKGCFDNIDHSVLVGLIHSKIKDARLIKLIYKFLKAGYLEDWKYHKTYSGTPQGGIISPTLANMTLDGLQTMLAEKYHKKFVNRKTTYYPKVHLVRYADDFIITGRSKEALEEIKPLVVDFLKERGLTLSEEKTKITHIDDGFDFLGYNIRKYKGVLLIKPSKKSLKKFMQKIRGIIDSNKGSKQESLIRLLNPVITGWVNYYKNCVASDTFRKADYLIFEKLWQWAKRRHPKKGKYWIADRYFTRVKNRNWCFVANFKKGSKTGLGTG